MPQYLTGKSRIRTLRYNGTVERTIALCATLNYVNFSRDLSSAGANGTVQLLCEFGQDFPGTITFGYRVLGTGGPMTVLYSTPKPAGGITYQGTVPPGSFLFPYSIHTWGCSVEVVETVRVSEYIDVLGTNIRVLEGVVWGDTGTRTVYVNGSAVATFTLHERVTPSPPPSGYILSDIDTPGPFSSGASGQTVLLAVPAWVNSGSNTISNAIIPALASRASCTLTPSVGSGMPAIPSLSVSGAGGTVTQTGINLKAPPATGGAATANLTLAISPLEDTSLIGRLCDLSGASDPTPQDVYVQCGGQQFKLASVSGNFSFAQQLGGVVASGGITGATALATSSHPIGPTGARLTPRLWPTPSLSSNPAGFTGAVATDPAFQAILPQKGPGLTLTFTPSMTLGGEERGWSEWGHGGNSTKTILGDSPNQIFRLTANSSVASGMAISANQFAPYRFVSIRVRSVGSANRKLTIGAGVTADFFTGDDGQWVERDIDLMLSRLVDVPTNTPTHSQGAFLYGLMTSLSIAPEQAGVYEIQWVRGASRSPAQTSMLRQVPFVGQSSGVHALPSLLGIVDGWIGIGQNVELFGSVTLTQRAAQINAIILKSWTASAPAVRSGKVPPFVTGDLLDGDSFDFWLGAGGVHSDNVPAWGIGSGAAMQTQPLGSAFSAYPGFEGFTVGGQTKGVVWQAITRSDAVAIGTTRDGDMVEGFTATGTIAGAGVGGGPGAAGSAVSGATGLARVANPGAQRGETLRITVEDSRVAEWGQAFQGGGSTDIRIKNPEAMPYNYYDFKTFFGPTVKYRRTRAFLLYLKTITLLEVMATDSARQYLYVASRKKLLAVQTRDFQNVFESAAHTAVRKWLSLCYDARTGYLYGAAATGTAGSDSVTVYRSRDGGRTLKELLALTAKSIRLEIASERNTLVMLYQSSSESDAIKRRSSTDQGLAWSAVAAVTSASVALSGVVLDMEEDPRRNGVFYLTLGNSVGTGGEDDVTEARFFRSSDAGKTWKQVLSKTGASFKLERSSEKQWMVVLRENAADNTVDRFLSRNGGDTWDSGTPALSGGEVLRGKLIDMEQDARASGTFFLTIGQVNAEGEVIRGDLLRSLDSGINWTPIESLPALLPEKFGLITNSNTRVIDNAGRRLILTS